MNGASPKGHKRVPLQLSFAVPFLLQIGVAVGLTGVLNYYSGQRAVQKLVQEWQSEVSDRVQDQIADYFTIPVQINNLVDSSFKLGQLNPRDLEQQKRYFLELHRVFPHYIQHISFGNRWGEYMGVRRSFDFDGFDVLKTDASTNHQLFRVTVDRQGHQINVLPAKNNYDPRQRPWYLAAEKAGQPIWSPPYSYFGIREMAITHVHPLYASTGELEGVIATDFQINEMNQHLQEIDTRQIGQVFLISQQGELISSSNHNDWWIFQENHPEKVHQNWKTSTSQAIEKITKRNPDLSQITQAQQWVYTMDGQRYFLQVVPLIEGKILKNSENPEKIRQSCLSKTVNLCWLMGILIPESNFTDQIDQNRKFTIFWCLIILAISIPISLRTSHWLSQPILQLQTVATSLMKGEWQVLNSNELFSPANLERQDAIGDLVRSFYDVSEQFHQSWLSLNQQEQTIEQQVGQRVQEIRQMATELRALFAAMTELILVMDKNGKYLKIAPTNPDWLPTPAQDFLGKTLHDIFPELEANYFLSTVHRALEGQKTIAIEYEFILEGEKAWLAANISPVTEDTVLWVIRNITQDKRAEEALRLSEEKFAKAFCSSPSLIAMTNHPAGHFIEVNSSFLQVSGYTREELLGKTAIDLNLWVDIKARSEMLNYLEKDRSFRNYEARFRAKSGEIRIGLLSAEMIEINDNLYNLYVVDDITERKKAEEALRQEQAKTEQLLLNVLPKKVAYRLKQQDFMGNQTDVLIAEQFEEVTILFADIVNFTQLSANISPTELVRCLNQIFSIFDGLSERHGLEKIKTIGDSYMVVGGLPTYREDHAEAIADMALEMQEAIHNVDDIHTFPNCYTDPIQIRIGINTGPVVAGVIGIKKFSYDLWGDTVNVASRMEYHGEPGKIQVTQSTYNLLKDKYHFEERGTIVVKGKGAMNTYWLTDRRS